MIRIAVQPDIDHILETTKACTAHLISQHIFQWNESYPNGKAFEKDIERNTCYVFEVEKRIIGCVTISTFMDEVYLPIKWLTPNQNNIYIHRLAVHPQFQGKGYAQQLMYFAEQFAIDNSYTSIRLDTFSQNKRNQKFYELRGYKKLEDVYFPKQSEHPFYCYELVL
ncbi:GNAT family N-acetyltransferase [Hyunsoonleella sp. SJ7]|uniref:GNAT family N-acetyltransferase n=1 Tax=Hyunsoonleella aquatilis TaxID=2762758 RepID=A0A923KKD5_9FLAO|nr:GNAT family N-acetyltransferase [Hyunsoonleella aquatilis]MBC3758392.1 GNAT family N-acetyltransferase [Hyunsoonleella aquatilis]